MIEVIVAIAQDVFWRWYAIGLIVLGVGLAVLFSKIR